MKQVLFLVDPLDSLKAYKDSSVFLMEEALARDLNVWVATIDQLYALGNQAWVKAMPLKEAASEKTPWYVVGAAEALALTEFDVVLMRKDPPFNMDYVLATYLLTMAEQQGVRVVNKPQALREFNEKCSILQFPDCITDTAVVGNVEAGLQFLEAHPDAVLKSLTVMGGQNIFHIQKGAPDAEAKLEALLAQERFVMLQKFMPEIRTSGDSRITLIDGEPLPYKVVRFPGENDFRANLAQGGSYKVLPLSEENQRLVLKVQPHVKAHGLYFVGLDVVGDYLTEINITCPTCLRELQTAENFNAAAVFWDNLA